MKGKVYVSTMIKVVEVPYGKVRYHSIQNDKNIEKHVLKVNILKSLVLAIHVTLIAVFSSVSHILNC